MAVLSIDGVVRHYYLAQPDALWNHGTLRQWLPDLARLIHMKAVGEPVLQPYGHWPGGHGAPSAVQFLEESAIVVHTYPERAYIEVTLHSCNPIPNWADVAAIIIRTVDMRLCYLNYEPLRNWRDRCLSPYFPHSLPVGLLELAR